VEQSPIGRQERNTFRGNIWVTSYVIEVFGFVAGGNTCLDVFPKC
jgi:hypothetical protein